MEAWRPVTVLAAAMMAAGCTTTSVEGYGLCRMNSDEIKFGRLVMR